MLIFWLLISTAPNGGVSTLAVLNDRAVCMVAAQSLDAQAKQRTASPNIYSYCVPIKADSLERK